MRSTRREIEAKTDSDFHVATTLKFSEAQSSEVKSIYSDLVPYIMITVAILYQKNLVQATSLFSQQLYVTIITTCLKLLSLDMLRPKEIIFKNQKLSRQTSKFRWH